MGVCRVHFLRNVLAQVPKGHAEMVAAAIRTIFAQPDRDHVRAQLDTIAAMLGRQFPKVETQLRTAKVDVTAFADSIGEPTSVSLGRILFRSPITPRSENSKIGALGSLLIATMFSAFCMPTLCWMAHEMPAAR